MTNQKVRIAIPTLYVVAILIALAAGGGRAMVWVAVIGALLVGLAYRLTVTPGANPARAERRAARRSGRRN